MRTKTLLLAIAALSIPALAQAEEGDKQCKGKKGCDQRRAKFIEKFDTDGDGKISEEEREAAKAAMKERKAAFIAKHDTDGDGKISEEEKQAAKEAFIAKYDTDGNGELDKEERQAAREAGARFPGKKKCHKGHKHGRKGGDGAE